MVSPLWLLVYVLLLLAVVFAALGVIGLRRRGRFGGVVHFLSSLLLLCLSALALAVAVGVHGYQALTREVTAATVDVTRLAPRSYRAQVTFPNGTTKSFRIEGDELYVDAHILKWKPIGTLLGLHTGYRLDRIEGRYASIENERTQPHTVYVLQPGGRIDLFDLARRYTVLSPFVDARYGSGTFVPLNGGGRFVIRVSTSGLLVRRAGGASAVPSNGTR
ncbi:MAG: hypothetical protein P8Z81_00325 [Deinococcales bacterium]